MTFRQGEVRWLWEWGEGPLAFAITAVASLATGLSEGSLPPGIPFSTAAAALG